MDFYRVKSICSLKDIVKRKKRQATEWEKMSAKHISDKRPTSRIYKELLKLSKKKIHNKEMDKRLEKLLNYPSFAIREMQINSRTRFHRTPIRIIKIKNTDNITKY